MTFQFDTSGDVPMLASDGDLKAVIWTDLDAFTQGYVEAMFAAPVTWGTQRWAGPLGEFRGFSDLAPETLVRIMEDCAGFLAIDKGHLTGSRSGGVAFWGHRQAGRSKWPPLTPSLDDDGKVYLSDGGSDA